MAHNDPTNLQLDIDGNAVLVCDTCEGTFTTTVKDALNRLRHNEGGVAYCSGACAAKAANHKRPRRHGEKNAARACRLDPTIDECPFRRTPPLQTADLRREAFAPVSQVERDLCIEYVRACMTLAQYAPAEGKAWDPEERIAWERADAVHDVTARLLEREVSRRES